jgi:hypothetical protein
VILKVKVRVRKYRERPGRATRWGFLRAQSARVSIRRAPGRIVGFSVAQVGYNQHQWRGRRE